MTARFTAAALALVLGFALTGCQKLEQTFTPEPTIVTEESTVAVEGAAIQGDPGKDMPEGLPMWPGAKVESSDVFKGTYTLVLTAPDTYDDVLNGLAVGLQRAGWEVAEDSSGDEGGRVAVLTVSTDGLAGFITLAESEAGTTIEYVLEPAP